MKTGQRKRNHTGYLGFISAVFLCLCMMAAGMPALASDPSGNAVSGSDTLITGEPDGASGGESGEESTGESQGDVPAPEADVAYCSTEQGADYVLYTPRMENTSEVMCLILLPSGETTESFMERTEWDLFAALDRFSVICLSADWDTDPEAAELYYEDIYQSVQQNLKSPGTASVFLMGYEDGADFASDEALRHTERYTGLVLFGPQGISEEVREQLEDQAGSPLSVWIFAERKTSSLTQLLSYWKSADQITGTALRPYSQNMADELYLPAASQNNRIQDSSNEMGAVLFSREEDLYDSSISGEIARSFITRVRKNEISFVSGITGGEIHRIEDWHYTYYRRQFEGQQRDYWIYVPDAVLFGTEPSSLILCLHGSGGTGENMIFQSMWSETAGENNCIVLYPTALYNPQGQHYWMNIPEELAFLRDLINRTCERYTVDRSRIYVTGFSNGAGMAQNLAIRCSDIFAAATLSAPAYFDSEYFGPVKDMHEVAILFSVGTEDRYLKQYQTTADINDFPALNHLAYWRMIYGFHQDLYKYESPGNVKVYTFTNMERIPVCSWVVVEGKKHEYPKEEVPLFFNFMKQYTKGEDGTLYYNGTVVSSRIGELQQEEPGDSGENR